MGLIDSNLPDYPQHYEINERWGLNTIFCVDGVEDVNQPSGLKADFIDIKYNTFFVDGNYPGKDKRIYTSLPKGELSWFQLWLAIEKLSKVSEDEHHIYIEEIYYSKKNKNTLSVYLGS
jgi:hypothetical protein